MQWLNQYPQWKIKLQGFADDPGTPTAQKSLSQRRAESVRNYLASHGIAPDRMLAKGYGRERLVADCADISCKSQNRRVITNPQESAEFGMGRATTKGVARRLSSTERQRQSIHRPPR